MDHERPTLVLDVMQAALSLAVKRFRESPVAPAGETIAIAPASGRDRALAALKSIKGSIE